MTVLAYWVSLATMEQESYTEVRYSQEEIKLPKFAFAVINPQSNEVLDD